MSQFRHLTIRVFLGVGLLGFFRIEMIISIDIPRDALVSLDGSEAAYLFGEIARASMRGYHLVICDRETYAWIREADGIAPYVKSHFKRLSQEYTQSAGLLTTSAPRASIRLGSVFERHDDEWRLGHRRVLEGEFLQPTRLIVEDSESDGALLGFALSVHAEKNGFPRIRFELVNGGGEGTYKRLRASVEGKHVSVCVCDHDMLAPYTSRAVTLRKAIVEGRRQTFVGEVLSLPAREIENLIPFEVLRDVFRINDLGVYAHLLDLMLSQGDCTSGDCMWLYFDVKKGLQGAIIRERCKDEKAKHWIMDKFRLSEWDDVNALNFPGFGDSIIGTVLEHSRSRGVLHRFVRGSYWDRHFGPFASRVCLFLASRAPERV